MTNDQYTTSNKGIWVNVSEVWKYGIINAIERYREYIDFSIMPLEEFQRECVNLIAYYFENEMLGNEIFYNDIVSDTAKSYGMWNC